MWWIIIEQKFQKLNTYFTIETHAVRLSYQFLKIRANPSINLKKQFIEMNFYRI